MVTWTSFEQFLAQGFAPVFGNNVILAGIFMVLALFLMLTMWRVGLETIMVLLSTLIFVLIMTTNLVPPWVGFLVIGAMLVPVYWALRGFVSR